MAITTSISAEAAGTDKRMTLDELREFVAECNRAEVPGDAWLDVDTKGLGKLRRITVVRR
jgi:hypothetical protein